MRQRCSSVVEKAVSEGRLPRLSAIEIKCTDCDERATCYDHRNYYHPLAVDPVCRGCNNRRGPGFPINPDGDRYTNHVARKLRGNLGRNSVGHLWNALNGGVKESGLGARGAEKTVAEFIDEHWLTWELDNDLRKYRQECSMAKSKSIWFSKSFVRGLYDWFGIEPV